jgi:hypothetical protein
MSSEEVEDFESWIQLLIRKVKRAALSDRKRRYQTTEEQSRRLAQWREDNPKPPDDE